MRIQPFVQNQNNINFQAVHEKYVKIAKRNFESRGNVSGHLLHQISDSVHFKMMSKQDALDTMDAISKYSMHDEAWDFIYNYIKNYRGFES